MSQNGDWNVQKSGKAKNKKTTPPKGNEKRPHTANGTGSKTAKEGSVATPKDNKTVKAVESPAQEESCPWLCVSDKDSDDGAKIISTTETNTPEKKKKHKRRRNKNKDKQESEHDARTPKGDSAETSSPQVTNGVKPDSDKTTAPKSTETKSEPQEGTGEESTKSTTAKSSDCQNPDDGDGVPMNWEDDVAEQDKASEDKSHAAVADEEEPSASQASPAEETSKGKIPTDNSAGEGSPTKKMTDSGARDKLSFGWKKSLSIEKLQTGGPESERDRQGSTEWKPTFKKPDTTPADANSKAKKHASTRDSSHERRSKSKEKGRQDSADRSRSDSNKMPRSGSGDRKGSDSTAGSRQSRQEPWEESVKNKRAKHDPGKSVRKGKQGAAGGWPEENEQPRIDCQPIVGFELKEIKGDLFSCAVDDAMAHCVSQDLEMGKGIAVLFKEAFRKVGQLRAQGKKVGEVAVLPVGASYVYYMITKERYFHKPTYQTLRSSMEAMRDHCKQNNVTSLAMPQIGCGLDKLNWGAVTEIIKEVFKNTGITVKIYIYGG